MFILIMVLLPVVSTLFANSRQNIVLERKLKVKHLAQSKLEEVKAMNWYDFKTSLVDEMEQAAAPEPLRFGNEYRDGKYLTEDDSRPENDFTYEIRVWPSHRHLIYTVQVTVFYKEAGQEKWETLYTEKMRR